jgi:hypothetical protein
MYKNIRYFVTGSVSLYIVVKLWGVVLPLIELLLRVNNGGRQVCFKADISTIVQRVR